MIHRLAGTARIRQWLPAAALIPLLILGLTFSRMQTVVRAEELLSRASHHERSLPADHVQRLRIKLTPGIPAFAPGRLADRVSATPRVAPFFVVRDVTGGVVRDAWPDGAAASGEYAALAETLARHGFELRQPLGLASLQRVACVARARSTTKCSIAATCSCSRPPRPKARCAKSSSPFAATTITSSNSCSRSRALAGSRSRSSKSRCRAR